MVQCIVLLAAPLLYGVYASRPFKCSGNWYVKTTAALVMGVYVLQLLCGVVPFTPFPIIVLSTLLSAVIAHIGNESVRHCDDGDHKRFLRLALFVFGGSFAMALFSGFLMRRYLLG